MDDQTPSTPENPKSQSSALHDIALKDLGQTFALSVAVAYICGFIVVTAYLGKFGLREYAAFRMQYLIAGATVFLLAGLFFYFVARNIGPDNTDVEQYTTFFMPVGGDTLKWSFLALLFIFVEIAFNVILCSVLSAAFLFPLPNRATVLLLIAIVSGGALIHFVMTSDARNHASPRSFVYIGTFMALAVIAFLLLVDGPYVELAYFYFAAFAFLNSYRYQQRSTTEPKALAFYFSIASIVAFSGLFGAFFYGHVRPDIGGGAPVTVRILIDEQRTTPELARVLQLRDGSLASVDLLAETDTELVIGIANSSGRYDELLRVKRDLVKAILMYNKRIPTPQ